MEETLNESITESTSVSSAEAENGESSFASSEAGGFGGGVLGDPLAPDEGYEYDFGEDSGLPMQTPFDQLLEFEEFDNLGDILGDVDPSDNPFAGGGVPSGDVPPSTDGDTQPSTLDDSASEGDSNNPFSSFNPNTESNDATNATAEGVEGMPSGGGASMMNADFSGVDNGNGNTDNGNGNNFDGDNNQADGNGNWSFGDGNQVNGNGNWNLNEEGGTPFDTIFAGENNPLTGGNPLGAGEEGGIPTDAIGGNNPIFAGGSTMPTPVGEGEIPDTAENPTGNQNTVNGNGNWNFGSDNDTSGNGNWNFGDGNIVTDGNGNWNLGDDNEVSGNGNRPSGNDNSISGNSNRVTGDGNNINGNRFNLDEDNSNILGNGDRYFQTDADGNVSLVSDESASDPNYDFSGVVEASADGEVDEPLNKDNDPAGQDIMNQVYGSLNTDSTDSLPNSSGALNENDGVPVMGGGSFGGGAGGSDSAGGNPFSGGAGGFGGGDSAGGNPFGGGAGGFGGGQMSGGNSLANFNLLFVGDEPNISFGSAGGSSFGGGDSAGGNPFGGAGGFGGGQMGGSSFGGSFGGSDSAGGNPFGGGAGGFGGGQMGGSSFSGGADGDDSAGDFGGGDAPSENDGAPVMDGSESVAPSGDNAGDFSGGQMGGDDLNELLRASPFGVLLDIPGVDGAEDIFGNLGGGAGGAGGFGGGSAPSENDGAPVMGSSEGGAPSGNPFANFNPLEDGNPLVEGDEPDVSFGGDSAGGGQMGGGSFGGDDSAGGNPFSGGAGGPSSLPETGEVAVGEPGSYVVRDDEGSWYISEDDVVSDDDTSLSEPEIPDVDGADSEGNPFGGSPFEYNPVEDLPDSSDTPAGNTFLEGEVPEGLSDEELAVSSEVADSKDAPAEDSSSLGGNPMESNSNYNWDFDFASSDSSNQDSPVGGSGAPELVDGKLVFDEMDFEIPLTDEEGNINPLGSFVPSDEGEYELTGIGTSVEQVALNEDGEFDPLTNAPAFNDGVVEIGEFEVSSPLFGEDYDGPALNSDGVLEVPGGIEYEIFDAEGNFNLPGVGTAVLGEDNVLQISGDFEIDLSEMIGNSDV